MDLAVPRGLKFWTASLSIFPTFSYHSLQNPLEFLLLTLSWMCPNSPASSLLGPLNHHHISLGGQWIAPGFQQECLNCSPFLRSLFPPAYFPRGSQRALSPVKSLSNYSISLGIKFWQPGMAMKPLMTRPRAAFTSAITAPYLTPLSPAWPTSYSLSPCAALSWKLCVFLSWWEMNSFSSYLSQLACLPSKWLFFIHLLTNLFLK